MPSGHKKGLGTRFLELYWDLIYCTRTQWELNSVHYKSGKLNVILGIAVICEAKK